MRHVHWLAAAILASVPTGARAQQTLGPYVGVTAGTHFERAQTIQGSAPSLGVTGGVRFARAWAAEIEYDRPTRGFVRERTCQCFSFASTVADFARFAVTDRMREERTVLSHLSIGAVYQPAMGRWRPRVFLGATRAEIRESRSYTILAVADGVDRARAEAARRPASHTRTTGGPAFGGGVSYRLSRHLSIGGDARYVYASLADEINNSWRTSMRTTWSF